MITKIIGDKEYQLTIEQDDGGYNPREDSNLGIMLYSHRNYILGDEVLDNYGHSLYHDFLHYINEKYNVTTIEFYYIDNEEKEIIEKFIEDNIIYLPVYLYDHSGLSIQTTPFACRWDSCKVGYIYSHKDNIKELILKEGEDGETKLKEILNAEIEYYDKYIRGEFYYYKIEERDILIKDGKPFRSIWEEVDSCGGLYEKIDILEYNSIFTKEEIESYNITNY